MFSHLNWFWQVCNLLNNFDKLNIENMFQVNAETYTRQGLAQTTSNTLCLHFTPISVDILKGKSNVYITLLTIAKLGSESRIISMLTFFSSVKYFCAWSYKTNIYAKEDVAIEFL